MGLIEARYSLYILLHQNTLSYTERVQMFDADW